METRYADRIVDAEIDQLLPHLPAISIEGAKGVGKTATAVRRAATVYRLDQEEVRQVVGADITRITTGATPRLLDEWQRLPGVFDVIRRDVDDGAAPGSYLLTGSPPGPGVPVHSGAGRIVTLRMRPFTLSERGATPTISLTGLLAGLGLPDAPFGSSDRPALTGASTYDLVHYVDEIVRSGFPGIRDGSERARRALLDGYLTRIVEREFLEMGHGIRNRAALRRWMAAYADACSSTASFEAIRDAATGGRGEKPSRDAAGPYRDVLERLHVLDPVSAWAPRRGPLPRIGVAPKHQLADPALAASLLGLTSNTLLESGRGLGALFESLVTLGVQVYAQAAGARVGHLRTHRGEHEVDLIVERPDGRIIAIEVKLGATVSDGDVRHLQWLHRQVGDDLLDAIVITTGREAYRRTDGVGVVPAALLGP